MKYFYLLLLLAPAALIVDLVGSSHAWVFILSAASLVPLAALMGNGAELVAAHT